MAPATPAGTPRQAGKSPINTFALPGPGVRPGGAGCATRSVIRAAGPVGMSVFTLRGVTDQSNGTRPSMPAPLGANGHTAPLLTFPERHAPSGNFRPGTLVTPVLAHSIHRIGTSARTWNVVVQQGPVVGRPVPAATSLAAERSLSGEPDRV